jgi:hypothetical protein
MPGGLWALFCIAWAVVIFCLAITFALISGSRMDAVDYFFISVIAVAPCLIGFGLWIIAKGANTRG